MVRSFPSRSNASLVVLMLVVWPSVGCPSPIPQGGDPEMPDPKKILAEKCEAGRAPAEPDLMGWDQPSRASLANLGKQGVVAVRYEEKGCDVRLEILPDCIGDGRYRYAPYAATDTKIIRSKGELYAQLPIGAASLEGKLGQNEALRTDFTLVGVAALPAGSTFSRAQLHGMSCERATHVVSRVYVGGFAMVAGKAREISARASLFGAGIGVEHDKELERIFTEGSAEQCQRALSSGEPQPLCGVPLRVGLLPLPGPPTDANGYAPIVVAPSEEPKGGDAMCSAMHQALDAAKTHFTAFRQGSATTVDGGAKITGSSFRTPGGLGCSIREDSNGATSMFCNGDPAPTCKELLATSNDITTDLVKCFGPSFQKSEAPASMMFPFAVTMQGPDGHRVTLSLRRRPARC